MKKICFGNDSRGGADTHEIMMSVLVTYDLRGKKFLAEGAHFMRNQLGQGIMTKRVDIRRLRFEKNSLFSSFYQFAA
jgi:hypothetical protein